ncbi:hypothetical protein F5Y05DRAFT_298059 [Hypoxylon sp. FL0543]|nr:hypothetical protein F5Y05DRAFT_298059 [Hypoxylon sp. FL0543]
MRCDCRRTTYRYACRHKERDFLRCWRYNLRKNVACVSVLVPKCNPHPLWTSIDRVCNNCYEFFVQVFGRRIAYEVSERFLEYKEYRGLSREAIDPSDIPFRDYISSAELATLGARGSRKTRQPFRAESPMRATRRPTPPPAQPRQPPPVVHRSRHGEHHATRSQAQPLSASTARRPKRNQVPQTPAPVRNREHQFHNTTSIAREVQQSHYGKEAQRSHPNRKPRPSRFREMFTPVYGEEVEYRRYSGDAQHNHYEEEVRRSYYNGTKINAEPIPTVVEYPVREYETNEPIDLADLVDGNETDDYYDDEYELVHRGRALNSSPHQPIPLRPRRAAKAPREQPSESSLVRRITDMAETIHIAGYSDHEREEAPSVPKIKKAPKVPHWRVDTPHPAVEAVGGSRIRSQTAVPQPRMREALPLRTAPATSFIRSPSTDSLKASPGRRRPQSQETVPIPPPRTAGLQNFRERGVPSELFLQEENNEVEQQVAYPSPTMLVSISTPSPAYSCAVQTCYCNLEDPDEQVCPSCRERRRLQGELSMKWI